MLPAVLRDDFSRRAEGFVFVATAVPLSFKLLRSEGVDKYLSEGIDERYAGVFHALTS